MFWELIWFQQQQQKSGFPSCLGKWLLQVVLETSVSPFCFLFLHHFFQDLLAATHSPAAFLQWLRSTKTSAKAATLETLQGCSPRWEAASSPFSTPSPPLVHIQLA